MAAGQFAQSTSTIKVREVFPGPQCFQINLWILVEILFKNSNTWHNYRKKNLHMEKARFLEDIKSDWFWSKTIYF